MKEICILLLLFYDLTKKLLLAKLLSPGFYQLDILKFNKG